MTMNNDNNEATVLVSENTDEKMLKANRIIELMKKRGYILTVHTEDYNMLNFITKDYNAPVKLIVQCIVSTGAMRLYSLIGQGLLNVSTEFISGIEDDERFEQFEGYIKLVLEKIKNK